MKYLIALPALALAACGTKEVPVLVLPPVELTTCEDMPKPPDLIAWAWAEKVEAASKAKTPEEAAKTAVGLVKFTAKSRDEKMLEAYLMLRSAYASCRGAVEGLKAWRESVE